MAKRERTQRMDDSENWEVADDIKISRRLETIVSVRFDAVSAAKVRRGASALNLTLSEFVRRAALQAAEAPESLRVASSETMRPGYVILVGGEDSGRVTGNLVWQGQGPGLVRWGEPTAGSVSQQSYPERVRTITGVPAS